MLTPAFVYALSADACFFCLVRVAVTLWALVVVTHEEITHKEITPNEITHKKVAHDDWISHKDVSRPDSEVTCDSCVIGHVCWCVCVCVCMCVCVCACGTVLELQVCFYQRYGVVDFMQKLFFC